MDLNPSKPFIGMREVIKEYSHEDAKTGKVESKFSLTFSKVRVWRLLMADLPRSIR